MQNEVILDPVQGNEPSMISTIRLHLQNILHKRYWSYYVRKTQYVQENTTTVILGRLTLMGLKYYRTY